MNLIRERTQGDCRRLDMNTCVRWLALQGHHLQPYAASQIYVCWPREKDTTPAKYMKTTKEPPWESSVETSLYNSSMLFKVNTTREERIYGSDLHRSLTVIEEAFRTSNARLIAPSEDPTRWLHRRHLCILTPVTHTNSSGLISYTNLPEMSRKLEVRCWNHSLLSVIVTQLHRTSKLPMP